MDELQRNLSIEMDEIHPTMCDMVLVKVGWIEMAWSLCYGSFMVKATKLDFSALKDFSTRDERLLSNKRNQKMLQVTKRTSRSISPKIAENVAASVSSMPPTSSLQLKTQVRTTCIPEASD